MPAPLFPIVQSPDQLPPGSGGLVIPHETTFISQYSDQSKTYRGWSDEATRDNVESAVNMRTDPVIMEPLETRLRASAQLPWHIEPDDAEDMDEVAAATAMGKRLMRMPRKQDFFMWLNEATWFGRSGSQVFYKYQRLKGKQGITPYGHLPINGDKLLFGYHPSDGRPNRVGIRVSGLFDGEWEATPYGTIHFLTPHERQSVVVHKYRPEDSDYRRPWKAGAVEGLGLRDRLYWFWIEKQRTFALLADYLQWFSQGLTVYYYPQGDEPFRAEMIRQAREGQGKPYLIWPVTLDGKGGINKPFDRLDPSPTSTNLLQNLVTVYYDGVIRRMILATGGTTMGGPSGGIGSDTANVLERTGDAVIKYDAEALGDTISDDMLSVMYAWTYPGMPAGRMVFEIDSPQVEQFIQAVTTFTGLGGSVGEDSTRKNLGLPAPKTGENILGQPQGQQPAAVDGVPQGVPIVQGQPADGQPVAGSGQ